MKPTSGQRLVLTIIPLLLTAGCAGVRQREEGIPAAKIDAVQSDHITAPSSAERVEATPPGPVAKDQRATAARPTTASMPDQAIRTVSHLVPDNAAPAATGSDAEPAVVVQAPEFDVASTTNQVSADSMQGDADEVIDELIHNDDHPYAKQNIAYPGVQPKVPDFSFASTNAIDALETASEQSIKAQPLPASAPAAETHIAINRESWQKVLDAETEIAPATAPSGEVNQVGCHLFCKHPPVRRECIDLGLGTISAVIHPCGLKYLAPYLDQIPLYEEEETTNFVTVTTEAPACPLSAWWEQEVFSQSRAQSRAIHLNVESLIVRTLANSKYLQGLADLPLIREKSTMEAIAEFDTTRFMESRFRRPSEPVGNDLTVGPGGSRRFRENDFTTALGIGRKTKTGARVELAQEIGLLNNNSTYLNPRHQGNTQLTLNITQPLMSGRGKTYNTSLIMLAKMDERVAWDQVSKQLQEYLVEVTENYWQLYLERARLKQKQRYLQRGEVILAELSQRRDFDAVDSQIARARAAVQSRRSELIRTQANVRNVESRLRGLVNDPGLYGSAIELIPMEIPQCQWLDVSIGDAMAQALQSRSEIDEAIQKVRAAGVRLSVARNELMPILDVVLETYLNGLRGSNDIGRAWVDQFSVGEPSYSVGVRYEIPINNRLAKNRHDRRRIEMRQAISQFQFQVEELMADVEVAVRNVHATHAEMLSRYEAMTASEIDLNYFQKRWELVPGDGSSASLLLDNILEAQDRLAAEESNFAQTQISYTMAIVELKRALGILLQSEKVEAERLCCNGLDQYRFHKNQGMITADRLQPLSSGDGSAKETAPSLKALRERSQRIEEIPTGRIQGEPAPDKPASGDQGASGQLERAKLEQPANGSTAETALSLEPEVALEPVSHQEHSQLPVSVPAIVKPYNSFGDRNQ